LRGKYFLREKEADCVNELVLEKSYITKKVFDYEACKMIASPIDTKNFT